MAGAGERIYASARMRSGSTRSRRLEITAAALAFLGLAVAALPSTAGRADHEAEAALDTAAPAPATIAPAARAHERGAGPTLPARARGSVTDTVAQVSHDLVLRHAVASPPARPALARWTLSHATSTSLP
jgi:hypothetical protein